MSVMESRSLETSGNSTSYTSASTSYPSNPFQYPTTTTTTTSGPRAGYSASRPSTARPRTGVSIIGVPDQELICAVTESRGISPTVGLAFINLDTGEAALSQINDSQTYVRTLHKLRVYSPSIILIPNTAANPPSKLFSMLEESQDDINASLVPVDRRYYAETTGLDSIHLLAFAEDVEAIKISIGGNYFTVCCFAAALKYIELELGKKFNPRTLRVKYEPSEGTMMIDASTICSMELIQNLQNPKSHVCLYGLLNATCTAMGSRLLRTNILQPSTNKDTITRRYNAVEELTLNQDMSYAVEQALKPFLDLERLLTSLIVVDIKPRIIFAQDSINQVIALKQSVKQIPMISQALAGARSELLVDIQANCASDQIGYIMALIDEAINHDTQHAKQPLEMRNQRTYAIRSNVNGLLDISRTQYKELSLDAYRMATELSQQHKYTINLKFEPSRGFYLRFPAEQVKNQPLPPEFINVNRKKKEVQCQVMDLMKLNQRLKTVHDEIVALSGKEVDALIHAIRTRMSILFKCCESIALLDIFAAFARVAAEEDYVRPELGDTLAIQAGRHPIRERFSKHQKFIPNDVFATQQNRLQIITGCNMAGKSTYIRSIALMTVMAQVGSFVPASYASFPIMHQLFAHVNMDDSIEANVSTFAAEMREMAFILRNIDRRSIAIIDELGRGTSTRDGLAIALAIAEALVDSRALIWFVTHFRDLATIMNERNGVANLHLAVDTGDQDRPDSMTMLYKVAGGPVQEQNYGLKLARVVGLPPKVLKVAEQVTEKLDSIRKQRRKTSLAVVREKKRKLILNLKEQLTQANNGQMQGKVLADWLRELQKEFVIRMSAIEACADLDETIRENDYGDVEEMEVMEAEDPVMI